MTSNNQVSPVIRISRGERDASARATHLKAASRKYLETTIERKQMSTTTNFKRIALVAVAALGLGVLSSVPSNAAINADSVTLSSATASQTTAETYTATSAVVTVSFFGNTNDSMSVTAALTAAPPLNTALPTLQLIETSSAMVETSTNVARTRVAVGDTFTANTAAIVRAEAGTVVTTAKFAVYLTKTNGVTAPSVVGSYSVKITPAAIGVGALQGATAQTVVITVSTAATASTTPDVTTSKVYLQGSGANPAHTPVADSSVVVSKEISATPAGFVYYNSKNAASGAVVESLTAEISGQGTLGLGNTGSPVSLGRSITVRNGDTVTVWADGAAGTGTITIKGQTSGVTLGTKTVTFYGATAAFTATTKKAILEVAANTGAVTFTAADSAGNVLNDEFTPLGGTQQTWYAISGDTTIATVASLNYASDSGTVAVTGVKAGSTTITIANASTIAAATIKSAPVTVRVGSTSVASVKVAFDKATYAPGEKAVITLSLLDATGLAVVPTTAKYQLWAAGYELATDIAFTNTTSITSETSVALAATTVAGTSTAGAKTYVVYMPAVAGKVTVTGTLAKTGSTTLAPSGTLLTAAAIQGTDVTASATVTDSGSAALAAVTALATTVASLKTLIVTLTNLVLKIQKKVKA